MGRIGDRLQQRYKDEGSLATKNDIKSLRRELKPKGNNEGMKKTVRMLAKGFGDIGRSLNTPNTNKRPKISQMPAKRPDIATQPCVQHLKSSVFGKDIRHRR